jgi:hypothetical protein
VGKKQQLLVNNITHDMGNCQAQFNVVCEGWTRYGLALENNRNVKEAMSTIKTEHAKLGPLIKKFEASISLLEQHATKMSKKWIGKKSLSENAKKALDSAKTHCGVLKRSLGDTDPNRAIK